MTTTESETMKSNDLWSTGNRLEVLTYLFIIFWTIVLLFETRGWQSTADWLFPALLGPTLILLSVARLLTLKYPWLSEKIVGTDDDVVSSATEKVGEEGIEPEDDDVDSSARDLRSDAIALTWIVTFPFLVYYFGFIIITPLFLLAFFYYYVGDLKTSVALSTVISGAIYLLFTVVLNSNLWSGRLF